ncbi:MAG: hypothetical protein WC343_15055, partial [Bacilli bacterium]
MGHGRPETRIEDGQSTDEFQRDKLGALMESTIKVRSNVVVRVWAGEQLLRTCRAHNTWGTAGLNALRNWLAGVAGTPITHIAWLDTGGVERARDIVTQRDVTTDGSLLLRQYLPSATSANGHTL